MNSKLLLVLFLSSLLMACGDRETDEFEPISIEEQQKYFPLQIGKSTEYQIDSIIFDPPTGGGGTIIDSNSYFVKEVIEDTLRGSLGQLQYRVVQYQRNNDTLPWDVARIWSAEINEQQAIRNEENLRFLRLIFPMTKRSEWDGHIWIDKEQEVLVRGDRVKPYVNWSYEVDSIDIARQVGNFSFDSTLVVTEVDETTIVELRYSRAVYAKNIGLVYREQRILDSQYCNNIPVPVDCETRPWRGKAEKGYILRQTVLKY